MKSRISIDVDYDNQPIIKIDYSESEDVRDKLVKKFLGTFRCQSNLALVRWTVANESHQSIKVRPIPPEILEFRESDNSVGSDPLEVAIKYPILERLISE